MAHSERHQYLVSSSLFRQLTTCCSVVFVTFVNPYHCCVSLFCGLCRLHQHFFFCCSGTSVTFVSIHPSMSESSSSRSTSISRVSCRVTPGSRNPFLTPLGNHLMNANNIPPQLMPMGRHTPPHMSNPHHNDGQQLQLLPNLFEEYFEVNTPDNPTHISTPHPTLPPPQTHTKASSSRRRA